MTFRYLLDTSTISDLLRDPSGRAARRLAVVGAPVVCTSIIVACELRYGAVKKGSSRLLENVEEVLGSLEILSLDKESDRHYAEIRSHLERHGQIIGANDLLIAAHALSSDLVLVTGNFEEFVRVPGLVVENWLID